MNTHILLVVDTDNDIFVAAEFHRASEVAWSNPPIISILLH